MTAGTEKAEYNCELCILLYIKTNPCKRKNIVYEVIHS